MNLCHVQRRETSLDAAPHTVTANDLRFFASLRMTGTCGFGRIDS